MAHGNCQKCRQPLSFGLDESVTALSPSTYDLLSASERHPHPPFPAPTNLSRLAPSLRPLYNAAVSPRAYATSSAPSHARAPPVRVTSPYSPNTHANQLGPGESFVVLDPTPAVSSTQQQQSQSAHASSSFGHGSSTTAAPLTPRITQLSHLYNLLSANSSIDHPLCTECMEMLLGMMSKELDESKKERERLVAFERDVVKRREEGGGNKDALIKEIAKVRCAF
jgi:beclin 1